MEQTVVLIRHGDAMGKALGQTDFERTLSDAGADALRAHFPRALSLVDVTDASELWVSTAVRARQTADIANDTLGIEKVRELDCMYAQDQDAFLEELEACTADVVVAVGHIPFMEDMCATLCGQYLGFATGAAAAVRINEFGRGRLEWFVQGPAV